MTRKTDEELLAEMKAKIKEEKEELRKELDKDYDDEDDNEEIPDMRKKKEAQPQVIEREINLALINDKLNYLISILQPKK